MSDKTINKLINIGDGIISKPSKVKVALIQSQAVLDKICELFEYAVEIITLAENNTKNNNRYAKTNAVLLRVLLEVLIKILLIKKHVSEYKTMEEQERVVRAFELKFCNEGLRHWKARKKSLKEMKENPKTTEQDLKDIAETEKKIKEGESEANAKIQEHEKEINDNPLLKSIAKKSIYEQAIQAFETEDTKKERYVFSALYQNCSRYIHPNHTFSKEEEVSKDLKEIERYFASIVLEFDHLSEVLNAEDRECLWNIIRNK